MDEKARQSMRTSTVERRVPPGGTTRVDLSPDCNGLFPETLGEGRLDLNLGVTDGDGELARWYLDEWWTEVLAHLGGRDATVHFLPTPGAMIHPVVIHHITMLRRVVPHWRVMGTAYRNDFMTEDDVRAVSRSLLHELRIVDDRRQVAGVGDRKFFDQSVEELFAQIRREQDAWGVHQTVLVRTATGLGEVEPSATTVAGSLPDTASDGEPSVTSETVRPDRVGLRETTDTRDALSPSTQRHPIVGPITSESKRP
ncbi:MAG: hypothetical protein ACPGXK_12995 [Phycisphaerae bacterium]